MDPGPAGVRLGPACLHLDLRPDPTLFSYLMAMLVPYLEFPAAGPPTLSGAAGLRLVSADDDRFLLRRWDGHGCLVLHTDEYGAEMWDQWTVARPWETDAGGRGFEPLWDREDLCEQERELLLRPAVAETARRSGVLRMHLLRELPVNPQLSHQHWLENPPARPKNPAVASSRASGVREILPQELVALEGPVSPSSLGDALAHQLITLLRGGQIRAGDVLLDHVALVTRLGGRGAAARWAQLAIEHVAKRYGLLRYRRRRPGDPAGRRSQGFVWAVSEQAVSMSGTASGELTPSDALET
ncbi:hypothetical protein [Streptomyces griseus]|uniref:hypothetical protein n=1 Tax=Streptomyces griseus TaxID=1911 RepID=UPI003794D593